MGLLCQLYLNKPGQGVEFFKYSIHGATKGINDIGIQLYS